MPKVKNPEFPTNLIQSFCLQHGLKARDLLSLANISVPIAYRFVKGEPVKDLTVVYTVYTALKEKYPEITWGELTGIS